MIISVLKKEAKNNLKGKWKKVILMMFVFFIVTLILTILKDLIAVKTQYGLLATIVNIAITLTLNYGILASMVKIKRNEKVNCFHFIYYAFRDGEKAWRVLGRLLLRMLLYIIALVLSGYLVITEIVSLCYGYGMRLSFFVEIIAFIAFTIMFCKCVLYYSLNNYILYDNNKWKTKEILNESKRLMTNHRWDFLKLNLSFVGWFILSTIFSVGIILALYFFANIRYYELIYISYIPLIVLLPYIYISHTCFYDNVLYNNPKSKEEANTQKTKKKSKKKKNNNK